MYDVESQTNNLLKDMGILEAPVDVYSIASKLGVGITEKNLEDEVSGFLVIKNGRAMIAVNSNHHPNRQRFTIAHELGHYCLHREVKSLFVDDSLTYHRDGQSSEGVYSHEIQANGFAASLLMPKRMLEKYLRRHRADFYNPIDVRRMAEAFQVSEQALTIRLVKLDLSDT